MNPNDYHILVFTLQDCFYYERCLPMGASSSCHIFDQISIAMQMGYVEQATRCRNVSYLKIIFFFIGPPDSNNCKHDLEKFWLYVKE